MSTLDEPNDGSNGFGEAQEDAGRADLEAQVSIARAVAGAGCRAHLYDGESNTLKGWMEIDAAVEAGVAFAVELRRDVLGLDLDDQREVEQLEAILGLLDSVGLRPLVLESGQPGRRHLFVWIPWDSLRAAVEGEVERLCGSRQPIRRKIRPPLSPHRLRLQVRLITPPTATEALRRLPGPEVPDPSSLSRRIARLLVHGDLDGRYGGDRSSMTQAIVTEAVNAQWSAEKTLKTLFRPGNKGGAKVREIRAEHGELAARRYFDVCWNKAQALVDRSPAFADRHDAVLALARRRVMVEQARWSGRDGAACRVVLLALLDRAVLLGSKQVHMSERHLADICQYSTTKISKTLSSLKQQGYIRRSNGKKGTTSGTTINLNRSLKVETPSTSLVEGCEQSALVLSSNHDAFEHGGGLGKRGQHLLTLMDVPYTTSELAGRAVLPVSTASRLLRRCQPFGIVKKQGETRVRAEGLPLTLGLGLLARSSGTHRAGLDRRHRHQLDRQKRQNLGTKTTGTSTGWVDPATGTFIQARPLSQPVEGSGTVSTILLTFKYKSTDFTIIGSGPHEMFWTEGADPRLRYFPAPEVNATAARPIRCRT